MTERLLITFMGNPKIPYRDVRYRFADGYVGNQGKYLFPVMCQWAKGNGKPVTRSLLLGTKGSRWDFVMDFVGQDPDNTVYEAVERLETNAPTQEYLRLLETALCNAAPAIQFRCELFTAEGHKRVEEQLEIVAQLNQAVQGIDELLVDLTHGLRSLGMVTMAALRMVKLLNKGLIIRMFYGAFELAEDGIAPVLEFEVADRLDKWARALEDLQERRSFAGLCDALPPQAADVIERMRLAERHLAVNDIQKAVSLLEFASDWFEASAPSLRNDACFALVEAEIRKILSVMKPDIRWKQLLAITQFYAGHNTERSVLALYESFMERVIEVSGQPREVKAQRRSAQFRELIGDDERFNDWSPLFEKIRVARNGIAHYSNDKGARVALDALIATPDSAQRTVEGWVREYKALK